VAAADPPGGAGPGPGRRGALAPAPHHSPRPCGYDGSRLAVITNHGRVAAPGHLQHRRGGHPGRARRARRQGHDGYLAWRLIAVPGRLIRHLALRLAPGHGLLPEVLARLRDLPARRFDVDGFFNDPPTTILVSAVIVIPAWLAWLMIGAI